MANDSIRVAATLPASPASIYEAWLDGARHGAMTEGDASAEPGEGGRFSAHSGYITGKNITLEEGKRILQSWRTTEFPADSGDSLLEILLEDVGRGTRVTIIHTEIPEGQGARYQEGWKMFYFNPMRKYFTAAKAKSLTNSGAASKPAAKTVVASPAVKKVVAKNAPAPATKNVAVKNAALQPSAKKTSAKPAAKKTSAKTAAKKTSAKPAAKKTSTKPAAKKATARKSST